MNKWIEAKELLTLNISNVNEDVSEIVIHLKKLANDFLRDILELSEQRMISDVEKEFQFASRIIHFFSKERRQGQEQIHFEKGVLCGEYKAALKFFEMYYSHIQNDAKMNQLMEKAHVRDIILYLYNNSEARHYELAEYLEIDKSQLTRIMNYLIDAKVVDKYGEKKFSYYILSYWGKQYCRDNFPNDMLHNRMIYYWEKIKYAKEICDSTEDYIFIKSDDMDFIEDKECFEKKTDVNKIYDFKQRDIYKKVNRMKA